MNLPSVLRITAMVAALGAVGGALGGIVIAAVVAVSGGIRDLEMFRTVVVIASLCGAVGGTVLGPLYAWTLLRRAPLWRAITETAFAAGVTVGLIFGLHLPWPWNDWLLLGGATVMSSAAAAARLRFEVDRKLSQLPAPHVS